MLFRRLYNQILPHLDAREVTVIAGPRQSGKTTLLSQLAAYLKNRVDDVVSLTLEDPSILARLNSHPENVFEYVRKDESRRKYILIDEIQYLANPSNFLKLLYDQHAGNIKLVVTGSSAFYIDLKFKDSLAGRKRIFELYTLSFDEFLDFRSGGTEWSGALEDMRAQQEYKPALIGEIRLQFQEYLTYGGYPAVVLARQPVEKVLILKDLLNSFVKRDILESNVGNPDKFYQLMLMLAHQTGSLMNVNELALTLRMGNSTVENYLYVMRKSYHISPLKPFHGNIRKELTKMPKVYFHDLGLRNILVNNFNPVFQRLDRGELAENYAFIRLRETYPLDEFFFWRTAEGNEIDFVVPKAGSTGEAIEIKYSDALFKPGKYRAFLASYPGYQVSVRAMETSQSNHELYRL